MIATGHHARRALVEFALNALDRVGPADDIAAHIHAAGVRIPDVGHTHSDPYRCAVAVYLRQECGFNVSVGYSGTRYFAEDGTRGLPTTNPPAVRAFLRSFDRGNYDDMFREDPS